MDDGIEFSDAHRVEQLLAENADLRAFNRAMTEQFEGLRREDLRTIADLKRIIVKMKKRITRLKEAQKNVDCRRCKLLQSSLDEAQSEVQRRQEHIAELAQHNRSLLDQISELNATLAERSVDEPKSWARTLEDVRRENREIRRRIRAGGSSSSGIDDDLELVSSLEWVGETDGEQQKKALRVIGKLWLDNLERQGTI
jgi:DNA repair exonuclease SbcCD ATPase subunit